MWRCFVGREVPAVSKNCIPLWRQRHYDFWKRWTKYSPISKRTHSERCKIQQSCYDTFKSHKTRFYEEEDTIASVLETLCNTRNSFFTWYFCSLLLRFRRILSGFTYFKSLYKNLQRPETNIIKYLKLRCGQCERLSCWSSVFIFRGGESSQDHRIKFPIRNSEARQ